MLFGINFVLCNYLIFNFVLIMRIDEKFRVSQWKSIRKQPNLALRTRTHIKKNAKKNCTQVRKSDCFCILSKKLKHFSQLVEKLTYLLYFVGEKRYIFYIMSQKTELLLHFLEKKMKHFSRQKKVKLPSHLVKTFETLFATF